MKKVKIIGIIVVAVLVVIVVLQNTEAVETRILWASVTMPRALLLFGALLVGLGTGFVVGRYAFRSRSKSPTT